MSSCIDTFSERIRRNNEDTMRLNEITSSKITDLDWDVNDTEIIEISHKEYEKLDPSNLPDF